MWIKLEKEHWYEHVPKIAETRHEVKLIVLWNKIVQTDRTIPNYKPDIIIRDNEEGTYMLSDAAISGDRNVISKIYNVTTEAQRMWNVKTKVMPVIVGATGTILKSLRKFLSNISGKHEVKDLQETAILGTAHLLRGVLL
jgi:hypothetical protein